MDHLAYRRRLLRNLNGDSGVIEFATEERLCHCFMDAFSENNEWTVYPETAGFDILLLHHPTGSQLGVQAKLRLNSKVADQILPEESFDGHVPDWLAVIIPPGKSSRGLYRLLLLAGIMVWEPRLDCNQNWSFAQLLSDYHKWFSWNPVLRPTLPKYIPKVSAGTSSPIILTEWKIKALRVMAKLELDGFITAKTIKNCGIDSRRFCCTASGWLRPIGDGKWEMLNIPRFDLQHPEVYAEILDEERTLRKNEMVEQLPISEE